MLKGRSVARSRSECYPLGNRTTSRDHHGNDWPITIAQFLSTQKAVSEEEDRTMFCRLRGECGMSAEPDISP